MNVTAGNPRSLLAALAGGTFLGADLSWQDQALCAQTDPEAFFPEKGGSAREAQKTCRSCEVRASCLAYALEHDDIGRFGIWGGFSERTRPAVAAMIREGATVTDIIAADDARHQARQDAMTARQAEREARRQRIRDAAASQGKAEAA
jgi:WhiB family redox-sensing transcriptional regulator